MQRVKMGVALAGFFASLLYVFFSFYITFVPDIVIIENITTGVIKTIYPREWFRYFIPFHPALGLAIGMGCMWIFFHWYKSLYEARGM